MNKDFSKRDEIIKPYATTEWGPNYVSGSLRFEYLTHDVLKQLIDEDFADPNVCHNEAPSTKEFLDFLSVHKNFSVGGYVHLMDNEEYVILIDQLDGISYWDSDEIKEFIDIAVTSDEPMIHSIDYDADEDYGDEGFIPGVICHAWWD